MAPQSPRLWPNCSTVSPQSAGKTPASSKARKAHTMTAKQRFLRDESGAVFAEWVVMTAVVVTIGLVALTAWRGDAVRADNDAAVLTTGV
ncbi:MAG: hypothetical protein CFE33_08775 [Pseudorhodobacter sp. PARRP1]|nr:MAG: hypothetical protein CFE33_08775 [Pseudorhodobacter sp. PARRP1]